MEKIMRLALLTSVAAAVSLIGVTGANADIYMTQPGYVASGYTYAPGYAYSAPAPGYTYSAPGYVYGAPTVVAEPPSSYVVVAPPAPVVNPPLMVAPPVATAPVVVPRSSGIVTTGFTTERRCFVDLAGFERCY
jgi:hypothetical protein